jgi:hypothetical protein
VSRSFVNDILLAMSCREAGVVLVTENVRDFARIAEVRAFDSCRRGPYPRAEPSCCAFAGPDTTFCMIASRVATLPLVAIAGCLPWGTPSERTARVRPRPDALTATYRGRGVTPLPDSVRLRFNLDVTFYARFALARDVKARGGPECGRNARPGARDRTSGP